MVVVSGLCGLVRLDVVSRAFSGQEILLLLGCLLPVQILVIDLLWGSVVES